MEMRIFLLQVQVSAAVLLVCLLRLGMKKMPKVYSYVLWLLIFLRLLCPISLKTDFALLPGSDESAAWVEAQLKDTLFDRTAPEKTVPEYGEDNMPPLKTESVKNEFLKQEPAKTDSIKDSPAPETDLNAPFSEKDTVGATGGKTGDSPEYTDDRRISGRSVLIIVWLCGVITVLGFNGGALAGVYRRLKKAVAVQEGVYVCGAFSVPFTMGFIRPKIYLPVNLAEDERDYIICHERVHIRRRDYLVKNIAFLLTAIYWFNPFVWIAFFLMERDMEMSCDEKVIKIMGVDIKKNYSQSLLNFAAGRNNAAVTPITFGEVNVGKRIKNLLSYKGAKRWMTAVGVAVLAATGILLFTVKGSESENTPTNEKGQRPVIQQSGGTGETMSVNEEWELAREFLTRKPFASAQEFEAYFGEAGSYDFSYKKVGKYYLPESFPENAGLYIGVHDWVQSLELHLANGEAVEGYERFTDPVSAAVNLLRLGEGTGEVTSTDYIYLQSLLENPADWLLADSKPIPAAGSQVTVTYTFADGSSVEIPMVLAEAYYSIWQPLQFSSSFRPTAKITKSWYVESENSEEDFYVFYNVNSGVYRLDRSGLTLIYPGALPMDDNTIINGTNMYFLGSGYNLLTHIDYVTDGVCILDLLTGAFDAESIPLNMQYSVQEIWAEGGWLRLHMTRWYSQKVLEYAVPLLEASETFYNGKPISQLTEEEFNQLGAENRRKVLDAEGTVELSNRTLEENYAVIDLDGDGKAERISLSSTLELSSPYQSTVIDVSQCMPYDDYALRVGEAEALGHVKNLRNEIWLFSPDGENILICLYSGDADSDPAVVFYEYRAGALTPVEEAYRLPG